MTGTPRTSAYLQTISFPLAGPAGGITPQQMQDFVASAVPTAATMTSGSSITMSTNILFVNKTSGSVTTVTLPSSPVTETLAYTVKDAKGDASSNNITVIPSSGNIDGISSFVMNVNYQSITIVFDGTNWWVM